MYFISCQSFYLGYAVAWSIQHPQRFQLQPIEIPSFTHTWDNWCLTLLKSWRTFRLFPWRSNSCNLLMAHLPTAVLTGYRVGYFRVLSDRHGNTSPLNKHALKVAKIRIKLIIFWLWVLDWLLINFHFFGYSNNFYARHGWRHRKTKVNAASKKLEWSCWGRFAKIY